jgi:hypothetical protein
MDTLGFGTAQLMSNGAVKLVAEKGEAAFR